MGKKNIDRLLKEKPIIGIGLALTKLADASRANVIMADLSRTTESTRIIKESRDRIRFLQCDVSNWQDLKNIVPFSESEFHTSPDVYVANAGISDKVLGCILLSSGAR